MMTEAEYCSATSCVTDWPSDLTVFCNVPNGIGGYPSYYTTCDQYHVLIVQGVDRQQRSYYDSQTGKLVAIVIFDANKWETWCAGPTTFSEPVCAGSATPIKCL
jgi:hypothetical protein